MILHNSKKINKYFILSLVSLIPLSGLANCASPIGQQTGRIKMSFTFPQSQNNFSIKKIPSATSAYIVQISGEAMSKMVTRVTFEQKVKYFDIPGGQKFIKIDAVNTGNKVLATSTKTINVINYITNSFTIELTEPYILPSPQPIATNTPLIIPTPTNSPVAGDIHTPTDTSSPGNNNSGSTGNGSPSPTQSNNSNSSSSNGSGFPASGGGGSSNNGNNSVNVDITVSPDDSELQTP